MAKSLRFWLIVGLALAALPLAMSAVLGHLWLRNGVIAPFADVAFRQRYQLAPAYRLLSTLADAVESVEQFVEDGDPTRPPVYRALRGRIEAAFADLHDQLQQDHESRRLVERSRDEWTAADHVATEAIAARRQGRDPQAAERVRRFHGLMRTAADTIGAAISNLERDVVHDHDEALLFYERSEIIAGVAATVSLLTVIAGVLVVGRVVSGSVERLVAGAQRFSVGDWEHRIDVQAPLELHRVAEEFNRTIKRLHEAEVALADLARRDGLTKLPNRRAFDDGIREMFARMHRLGEAGCLLMVDIDYFNGSTTRMGTQPAMPC
jgi:HAMP domain-containing protein